MAIHAGWLEYLIGIVLIVLGYLAVLAYRSPVTVIHRRERAHARYERKAARLRTRTQALGQKAPVSRPAGNAERIIELRTLVDLCDASTDRPSAEKPVVPTDQRDTA